MNDPDKAVIIIFAITFIFISVVSFLVGFYINIALGVLAFLSGIAIVMIPGLMFWRYINKPNDKDVEALKK